MLSGRDLCDELITRPDESYRLWCVVVCDLETLRMGAPYIYIYIYDISRLRVNLIRNPTYCTKVLSIFLIPSRRMTESLLHAASKTPHFTVHGQLVTACSYTPSFPVNARSLHNLYLFSTKSKIPCTCVVLHLRCL